MTMIFATALFAATASPMLMFDEIGHATDVTKSARVHCVTYPSDQCSLTRKSIANVWIERSNVLINKATRRPIVLFVSFDHPLISEMLLLDALNEKYGRPSTDERKRELNKQGGPYESRVVSWTSFSDGKLSLVRAENNITLIVQWNGNAEPTNTPKVDF